MVGEAGSSSPLASLVPLEIAVGGDVKWQEIVEACNGGGVVAVDCVVALGPMVSPVDGSWPNCPRLFGSSNLEP